MNYEVVNLEEKKVVGVSARTNNNSPEMGRVIGGLWSKFYQEEIYAGIQEKVNNKALGIYTDYEGNEKDDYTVVVACEAGQAEAVPEGTVVKTIPAGKYAKFVIVGDVHQAVADFWGKLWQMELPRTFVCDFEEYQNSDMEQAEIHVYIGLKEE